MTAREVKGTNQIFTMQDGTMIVAKVNDSPLSRQCDVENNRRILICNIQVLDEILSPSSLWRFCSWPHCLRRPLQKIATSAMDEIATSKGEIGVITVGVGIGETVVGVAIAGTLMVDVTIDGAITAGATGATIAITAGGMVAPATTAGGPAETTAVGTIGRGIGRGIDRGTIAGTTDRDGDSKLGAAASESER
jgi:hypothetical protein